MNDPNLPPINQESNEEQKSGNMYSYNDDVSNSNNQKGFENGGAIRRSLGEGNPNADFAQPNYNNEIKRNTINNEPVKIVESQYYDNNNENNSYNSILNWTYCMIYIIIETILILFIGLVFKYDMRLKPELSIINNEISEDLESSAGYDFDTYYGIFRDINIMVFIGFGMLHTLYTNYAKTSISINALTIALSVQIGLISNSLWENAFKEKWRYGIINFITYIKAIMNASTVIISLGCVLGKLSFIQYLIMIIVETIISSLNFQLCHVKLKTIDTGGSLYVHTFGTIFGMAIYMVFFCSSKMKNTLKNFSSYNTSNYFSNVTSFIGVLFLWVYFPSFNCALAMNEKTRYYAIISTYFSLTGSLATTFITSALFNKGRFVIEQILFASFSGGVIISGCCSVCIDHWAALLIGCLSGVITVTFLHYVKPFFIKWGFDDFFNVIIIHGIPGILGALITPMMISGINRRRKDEFDDFIIDDKREHGPQAGIQICSIFITVGLSFISGIATGYLMKVSSCGKIVNYFKDVEFFEDEENGENQVNFINMNTRPPSLQNRSDYNQKSFENRASQPSYNY